MYSLSRLYHQAGLKVYLKLFENAVAYCQLGYMNDGALPIVIHTKEIQALGWQALEQLQCDINICSDEYSPWLRIAFVAPLPFIV